MRPHDKTNTTWAYYERFGADYANKTRTVDMRAIYDRFLAFITQDGLILDAGSGSGRDTGAFLDRGYNVEAFDESRSLAALSSSFTGVRTDILRFQDIAVQCRYDGIWACASLLHLKRNELSDALSRLATALVPGGVIYASFKLVKRSRLSDDGRWFTDMDEEQLSVLLKNIPTLLLVETWRTQGEGEFHGKSRWLNLLLRRSA